MNLPIYEGFFFFFFFSSLRRILWLCFLWSLSVETLGSYEHRRAMPMSERSSVLPTAIYFSCVSSPCASGLTGCGCLGIIIIISGEPFEPKLEPWLCTPDSCHFQHLSLFKWEGRNGEGETGGSPGAYLSLKSHLHALSLYCFLKGASITMPNLVNVLIKGLLYHCSLHNRVRCLWRLTAQRIPANLLDSTQLSSATVFVLF